MMRSTWCRLRDPNPKLPASQGGILTSEISLWESLSGLPQADKHQWQAANPLIRWLVATRAVVYPLTLFACLFAGVLSWPWANPGLFLLACCGVLLAHGTNNLINDRVDYQKGLDRGNYFRTRYGVHPLVAGLLSLRQHAEYILITGGLAVVCGAYVCFALGHTALLLMLAGSFFVLFYTHPLKRIALGEIAVWCVWGPLMVGSLVFVATGHWVSDVLWLGGLYGLGPLLVILGKHTDKIADDEARNVVTLPTLLGRRNARWAMFLVMLTLPLGGLAWAMVAEQPSYLLLLLLLPLCARCYGQLLGEDRALVPNSDTSPPGVPATVLRDAVIGFHFARYGGLLLLVASLVDRWV